MNVQLKMIVKDALILLVVSTFFVTIINKGFKGLKKPEIQDPIVTAVMQENVSEIKELLKENASEKLKFQDTFGRNALMWSAYANLEDKKLLSEAEAKRLEMAQAFIASGIDVNLTDKDGWSALMWSSWSGLTTVTKLLLDSGADVKLADENGNTALMLAAMRGNKEIVELLISRGADKSAKSVAGKTATDLANEMSNQYPKKREIFQTIISILG